MTKRIITPFANSGTKNTIPDTAPGSDNGFANYPNGFPASNSVDPALGGAYVKRADFNGAMYDVTSILKDQAQGLIYAYDATYATAISGYPVAAILSKVGGVGFWLNTTAGNATNPDTGGAGWVDFSPKSIQNNLNNHATAGGTADAITATYTPAYAAYADGMTCFVKLTAANATTTPTFSPNGLTTKTIVKGGGVALRKDDLVVGMIAELKYNSTMDKWICQNPDTSGLTASGINIVTTTSALTYAMAGGLVRFNSATAIVPTLPAASTYAAGKILRMVNNNAGIATVTRAGADTITVNSATVTTVAMGLGDTLELMSDGVSTWFAVGGTAQLSYSNNFKNGAGYVFLPDGTLIQRGNANFSPTGPVNLFPIAFPVSVESICYGVTVAGNSGTVVPVATSSQTLSQFASYSSGSTGTYTYIAIGRWK